MKYILFLTYKSWNLENFVFIREINYIYKNETNPHFDEIPLKIFWKSILKLDFKDCILSLKFSDFYYVSGDIFSKYFNLRSKTTFSLTLT